MANEHDNQDRKFTGYYEGPVIDNKDPMKLGRVRVNVPGVAEPTPWAMPVGGLGAGGKKRGSWSPPPVGAEVGVFFKQGDPDHPRYMAGPIGEGEAPDEVDDASVEDATKVPFVFNGERYKIVVDERPGKSRAALEDKLTGDRYEIDGQKLGLYIKATNAVVIEADGAIDFRCASFTVNGRRCAPGTKPF